MIKLLNRISSLEEVDRRQAWMIKTSNLVEKVHEIVHEISVMRYESNLCQINNVKHWKTSIIAYNPGSGVVNIF